VLGNLQTIAIDVPFRNVGEFRVESAFLNRNERADAPVTPGWSVVSRPSVFWESTFGDGEPSVWDLPGE
jgi:hypothetical protein